MRYFFLMRKGDSQLIFDVDVARSQSDENPVVLTSRWRTAARVRHLPSRRDRYVESVTGVDADLSSLTLPEEQMLMKALLDYPALVAGAAEALEPHRVATYLHDTAGKIHLWYHKAHVLNEPDAIMRAATCARACRLQLGVAQRSRSPRRRGAWTG